MSVDIRPSGSRAGEAASTGAGLRVAVLFERSPNALAALGRAAELTRAPASQLTVVTLAPQHDRPRCCGPSAEPLNCAVREDAERDLLEARELVGPVRDRAAFKVLVTGGDPPLAAWIAEQDFDLVLLPNRRFTLGGHPAARKLRRATRAEVRLVG